MWSMGNVSRSLRPRWLHPSLSRLPQGYRSLYVRRTASLSMSEARDIAVTWPQTKLLAGYLAELARAERYGLEINYRVRSLPSWPNQISDHGWNGWPHGVAHPRCYMIHSGFVRGWCEVNGTCWREDGEVDGWPAGNYIVRDPAWHPVDPVPMVGFRGWRWYSADQVQLTL